MVPVFNAMPYLGELLDSLAAQDLDPEHFELILVDDGSTDGGPQLMDRFAAAHPRTRVIRQRNSGWPGQPRNRGLAATEADYVFFADAGDMLASHALRSMLDYAQLHQADMVLPRIAGLNGRPVNRTLLAKNNPKAELREVFATLAPQKLIRRALIERLELRFPEGRVRLEDGIFITACYLAAERTAVLADDDYYFLRARQDANNISARKADPEGCTRSVARIAEQVRAARLPADLEQGMVLDLYRRKILRTYRPGRWLGMGRWRRRSWNRSLASRTGSARRRCAPGMPGRCRRGRCSSSCWPRTGMCGRTGRAGKPQESRTSFLPARRRSWPS
ncbi:glycosyltransferase family 2 protein [Glutamicibacter soli]|nr:glycosyltransferase family A protein [Glutamicibacter soli]